MNKKLVKQISISLILLLLGFGITIQLKSVSFNKTRSTETLRASELQAQLNAEKEKNESLTADLENIKAQLSQLREGTEVSALMLMTEQLDTAEKLAGTVALTGPGVTVTIKDSPTNGAVPSESQIIHDSDIRTVTNELFASGAEAVSVNGERIVSTTAIRCVGPTITINGTRLSTPFIIKAIGDAKTLEAGLIVKGGVVDALAPWGINISISHSDKIEIPAYSGATTFKYAKTVEIKKQIGGDAK